MNLTEVWSLYKADKQIQGYSPQTLKSYYVQFNLLVKSFGNISIREFQLILLKFIWKKQWHPQLLLLNRFLLLQTLSASVEAEPLLDSVFFRTFSHVHPRNSASCRPFPKRLKLAFLLKFMKGAQKAPFWMKLNFLMIAILPICRT
ncbi:hypothetical protein QFZ73_004544 [Peribacillus sp. V2I11]|nr:hypothetical protein [Peribacillus sp. V2I11]